MEKTLADRLDELGDEIARLAGHLHAGMARYLALEALPAVRTSMARGRLSFSQARALTRATGAEVGGVFR